MKLAVKLFSGVALLLFWIPLLLDCYDYEEKLGLYILPVSHCFLACAHVMYSTRKAPYKVSPISHSAVNPFKTCSRY
jgi:hypothetical protein